jgi:signal transduction histidine kinase
MDPSKQNTQISNLGREGSEHTPHPDDLLKKVVRLAADLMDTPYAYFYYRMKNELPRITSYTQPGADDVIEAEKLLQILEGLDETVVLDACLEPALADHPAVAGRPGIRFCATRWVSYEESSQAGICVLDPAQRTDPSDVGLRQIKDLAELALEISKATAASPQLSRQATEGKQGRSDASLAEALQEMAGMLNSSLDLEVILDRMQAMIERVVPHNTAAIILLEKNEAIQVREYGDGKILPNRGISRGYKIEEIPSLRIMRDSREPLVIANTQSSILWIRKPHLDWVQSYLGAPIISNGQVIGFLNLNSAAKDFYNNAHARRLQAFANQAAIALHNARLFKRAQAAATLEERQRLARDLHDAVSQSLWTASIIAEVLPSLWERDQAEGLRSLDRLRRLTQGALAEMRILLLELRPAAMMDASLEVLLGQLAQSTMSRRKMDISLDVNEDCGNRDGPVETCTLEPEVKTGIFRIAQEAFNNIAKHSQARRVVMALRRRNGKVYLEIRDDGLGFDMQNTRADRLGLGIMRERAARIGARLLISSEPGGGTKILIEWPETDLNIEENVA